ncbi:MAG: hypothetical protein INR72_15205 [Williamsia herbipolensis]|nr:hypothetical protein [Williamsia herbipolensis]
MGTVFAILVPASASAPKLVTGEVGNLSGVVALGPHDVWTSGYSDTEEGATVRAQIRHHGTGWQTVHRSPATGRDTFLNGIDADSPADVWAVGTTGSYYDRPVVPFALHRDGDSWTRTLLPRGASPTSYSGISVVAPDDVWAVGSVNDPATETSAPIVAHWDGTAWTEVDVPDIGNTGLSAVSMSSATDGWAVPYESTGGHARRKLLDWNGTTWSVITAPALIGTSDERDAGLSSVDTISPTDAWAGTYGGPQLLHWNGTAWKSVDFGFTADSEVSAVASAGPDDVWAAGTRCPAREACSSLFVHWNGTAWKSFPAPSPDHAGRVTALAVDSAKDAWAVAGYEDDGEYFQDHIQLMHWDGTSWATV